MEKGGGLTGIVLDTIQLGCLLLRDGGSGGGGCCEF